MRTYGQFCPVAQAAEVITERWTPLVIRELLSGSHRFNDIQRGVPLMSSALLAERLKSLERSGIVERRQIPGRRAHEYHLTQAGEELRPWVEMMGADRPGRTAPPQACLPRLVEAEPVRGRRAAVGAE